MSDPLALLVWYRVTSGTGFRDPLPMRRTTLIEALKAIGVDDLIVPELRATESFVAATAQVSTEYERGDAKIRLEVRKGKTTTDVVTRHVYLIRTRGLHSEAQRVADLTLFRPRRSAQGRLHGTERLRTLVDRRLDPADRAQVDLLVNRVTRWYEERRLNVSGQLLRGVARDFLSTMGGAPLIDSRGSTYLVPPEMASRVEDLGMVIAQAGDLCALHCAPVPDSPPWRQSLIASLDLGYTTQATVLADDMVYDLHRGRVLTRRKLQQWQGRADALQQQLMLSADRYAATFPNAAVAFERLMGALADVEEHAVA